MEGFDDIKVEKVETLVGSAPISIETGYFAKQASGAVIVRQGETAVLVAVVVSDEVQEDIDFLPLTVEYREKPYSYGRIPGGFVKREGKPNEREILVSRLIDRPIRPLFPKGFFNDVIIYALTLSADDKYDPDVLAIVGASCALHISEAPFEGPVAGVRVARVDGKLIVNPTYEECDKADLDIVVAGTKDAIVMVEGGANEVPEDEVLEAILYAQDSIKKLCKIQEELRERVGKDKIVIEISEEDIELKKKIRDLTEEKIREAFDIKDKKERNKKIDEILNQLLEELEIEEEKEKKVEVLFKEVESEIMRELVLKEHRRIDGRKPDEIRPIWIKLGLFPRSHGSAIFTRGQTQALVMTTLGALGEEQIEESIEEGEEKKRFILHYNFPSFSTGEAKPPKAPSRREIGHGHLAERAIEPLIPSEDKFPYVIRVVSEILESNGSSSMATVCGASLSLFDAGVPLPKHVAGIAMGLLKEEDNYVVLTDILGDEDHLGDMDFKVAGTRDGITSIQMDIKIKGLTKEILQDALQQANKARMKILDIMYNVIPEPREEVSKYAPKVITMEVAPEKIPLIIGPAGKNVKKIIDETGVKIDLEENGLVRIYAPSKEAGEKAKEMIEHIVIDIEPGEVYMGKVVRVEDYGAFIELFPGKLSLLHVSKISHQRVRSAKDHIKVGDVLTVKVLDVDEQGRARVSLKDVREGEEAKNKHLYENPSENKEEN